MFNVTTQYLIGRGIEAPQIALILGSGLGELADEIESPIAIPYEEIPNFPVSTVAGHAGKLIYGTLEGKKVIALQGRFHYYEGYDLQTVTYPVRIFKELGVQTVVVTNAAGGVNEKFSPGDLMIITDHLNITGENPLIGANIEEHGPRFVDMTETYSKRGQQLLKEVAADINVNLQEGVYTWFTGPTYETPAEIRYARAIGGDAVGMSTVPEAIVAKHAGMEVIGISCITNLAAGMQVSLNHEEVMEYSQKAKPQFKKLLRGLISRL
ncbi:MULTISPECIES: purine-nucleoside phosphorylase [unclassified Facklamia]|uniref:purine-nucleoside phosphorylase n=1 Tax=Aerococcaceae TaxID=186827 RepID=UPI0013BB4ACB|nr:MULTISPECIES: purine-nucleoside phosphorylase [unclassified Facklamia]NEW64339.1 purine-nucleoside phosphorylase [Facklamia sp. 252]NEW67824.1 purine-nucleoside phosphorylase [Facklamia sp. 253]QQD64802.1 purine-nucleoside phosphorylase [Aerococcaceae bacterium zg-252]